MVPICGAQTGLRKGWQGRESVEARQRRNGLERKRKKKKGWREGGREGGRERAGGERKSVG